MRYPAPGSNSLFKQTDDYVAVCLGQKYKLMQVLNFQLETIRSHGQKTEADLERMKRLRDEMRRLAEGFE